MRFYILIPIFLLLACAAEAQVWPGGALCGSETGLPCSPAGHASLRLAGAMLRSDHWRDTRSRFGLDFGLGRGLGLSITGSTRDLKGYGAFERGLEDTRFGLSLWPSFSPQIRAGLNGYLSIPTGYRTQQRYFDSTAHANLYLPEMSLKQTAGEIYSGAVVNIADAAELNVFGGYFCASDKTEQAFRWGVGTKLTPFGESCWAEFNFAQSITRIGVMPSTQTFEAALPFHAGWGITLAPGLWADLDDEPLYGASLGFRFDTRIPGMVKEKPPAAVVAPPRIAGLALVAPPRTDVALADGRELWQSIQDGVHENFDDVRPLSSLNLPGLPFSDRTEDNLHRCIQALGAAHPEADYLLLTRVIHEDVSKQSSFGIPLVVSRPVWAAQCKIEIQLVDLRAEKVLNTRIIQGHALKKDFPQLAAVSPSDDEVLSLNVSRQLTFEAYRNAAKEIARELVRAK